MCWHDRHAARYSLCTMMQPHPLRLLPGDDLRGRLEALAREERWSAAYVLAGIGSLRTVALRLADAAEPRCWAAPMEILSLAGSLGPDGAHLHATLADAEGRVIGGHVALGCEVRTTAELMLVLLDDHHFGRQPDAATGYAELTIDRLPRTAG
jgi:uncharacterized protein